MANYTYNVLLPLNVSGTIYAPGSTVVLDNALTSTTTLLSQGVISDPAIPTPSPFVPSSDSIALQKRIFSSAIDRRIGVSNAVPAAMAAPPTRSWSGPGGASPIASPNTLAYNASGYWNLTGMSPAVTNTSYFGNFCNGGWTRPGYWVEFDYYGTAFAVRYRDMAGSPRFWVWVDGVPASDTSEPTSGVTNAAGSLFRYVVTFGSAGKRRIRILMELADFGGLEIGPTDTVSSIPARDCKLAFYGDSWIEGAASVLNSDLMVVRCGEALGPGFEYFKCGQGGTGYVATGGGGNKGNYSSTARLNSLATISPDLIVVQGSINDDASNTSVFNSANTFFSSIRSILPSTKIICVGVQATASSATTANRIANNTALKSAAAIASNVISFIDPINEGWITGSGYVGATAGSGNSDIFTASDNTHPSTAGHRYWADRLYGRIISALQAYVRA